MRQKNILATVTELNAKFLSLIAWCDGKVDDQELARFHDIIDACPGSAVFLKKVKNVINEMPDREACLKELSQIPAVLSAGILKNAYVVAHADKHFDVKEKNLLLEAGMRIGLAPEQEDKFFTMLDHYAKQYQIQQEIF
jgi:tellurite resistance protein